MYNTFICFTFVNYTLYTRRGPQQWNIAVVTVMPQDRVMYSYINKHVLFLYRTRTEIPDWNIYQDNNSHEMYFRFFKSTNSFDSLSSINYPSYICSLIFWIAIPFSVSVSIYRSLRASPVVRPHSLALDVSMTRSFRILHSVFSQYMYCFKIVYTYVLECKLLSTVKGSHSCGVVGKMAAAGTELLFNSVKSQITAPQDCILCALHWQLVSSGYKCIGVGENVSSTHQTHFIYVFNKKNDNSVFLLSLC